MLFRSTTATASSLFTLVLSVYGSPSWAFDSHGHKQIELHAYRALAMRPAQDNLPSGQAILDALVSWKMLDRERGDNLPQARSAKPDFTLERQFYGSLQGFHFMASNKEVRQAVKGVPDPELAKQKLLEAALPDCLMLSYFLFDEAIRHPLSSRQSGRGMYVLMHVVADAYSSEHVTRDANNKLETVKGWRTTGLVMWHSPAARATVGNTKKMHLLHRPLLADSEDKDWSNSAGERLSEQGLLASEALQMLLVDAYKAHNSIGPQGYDSEAGTAIDAIWKEYVEKHFMPSNSQITDDGRSIASKDTPPKFSPLRFNYRSEVELPLGHYNRLEYVFDRFPRHQLSALWRISNNTLGLGLRYRFTVVPCSADGSLIKRLPISWGGEAIYFQRTSIKEGGSIRAAAIKTNLGFSLAFFDAMPIHLYGIAGLASPVKSDINPSIFGGFGVELAKWHKLAIGYEYTRARIMPRNSFRLGYSFNTWHARRPNSDGK